MPWFACPLLQPAQTCVGQPAQATLGACEAALDAPLEILAKLFGLAQTWDQEALWAANLRKQAQKTLGLKGDWVKQRLTVRALSVHHSVVLPSFKYTAANAALGKPLPACWQTGALGIGLEGRV